MTQIGSYLSSCTDQIPFRLRISGIGDLDRGPKPPFVGLPAYKAA